MSGYDQTVTLAQVFWMQGPAGRNRSASSSGPSATLSHRRDFFRASAPRSAPLRKRLRASERFRGVPTASAQYGAWFRRRFGIDNEQALELFHQTVSMKSVGNLTEFVRGHMLEPFDVASRASRR